MEKRTTRRQPLFLYLKVYDHNHHAFLGYLTDISPEGLMILSEGPIDLEQNYRLEIEWGPESQSVNRAVFSAYSVWTGKDANPRYRMTGFKFADMDDASLDTVHSLIETYGFMA